MFEMGSNGKNEVSIVSLKIQVFLTHISLMDLVCTGKTFVYKCLNNCIEMGYDVIPVAWTGIAAMLLPGGRTVHSRFKLPLILTDTSVSSLKVNSKKASTI